jgi:two-component system sensor histidine kinase/response regulator
MWNLIRRRRHKIEARELELERIPMDVRQCVAEVGSEMAAQAAAKQLKFIVNIDATVPGQVSGDPHRLHRILINLCGNAIKFTQHGEVVVEVLPLSPAGSGRILLGFAVRDTGMGMLPEVIEGLYQPFMQADRSTTRRSGGAGPGLSIVRRLVELMGGEIRASSAPGQGSTVVFTLPYALLGAPTGL